MSQDFAIDFIYKRRIIEHLLDYTGTMLCRNCGVSLASDFEQSRSASELITEDIKSDIVPTSNGQDSISTFNGSGSISTVIESDPVPTHFGGYPVPTALLKSVNNDKISDSKDSLHLIPGSNGILQTGLADHNYSNHNITEISRTGITNLSEAISSEQVLDSKGSIKLMSMSSEIGQQSFVWNVTEDFGTGTACVSDSDNCQEALDSKTSIQLSSIIREIEQSSQAENVRTNLGMDINIPSYSANDQEDLDSKPPQGFVSLTSDIEQSIPIGDNAENPGINSINPSDLLDNQDATDSKYSTKLVEHAFDKGKDKAQEDKTEFTESIKGTAYSKLKTFLLNPKDKGVLLDSKPSTKAKENYENQMNTEMGGDVSSRENSDSQTKGLVRKHYIVDNPTKSVIWVQEGYKYRSINIPLVKPGSSEPPQLEQVYACVLCPKSESLWSQFKTHMDTCHNSTLNVAGVTGNDQHDSPNIVEVKCLPEGPKLHVVSVPEYVTDSGVHLKQARQSEQRNKMPGTKAGS